MLKKRKKMLENKDREIERIYNETKRERECLCEKDRIIKRIGEKKGRGKEKKNVKEKST